MDFEFELVLPELPRTMKKAEWKQVSRWLRICRRKIKAGFSFKDYRQPIADAMLWGTGQKIVRVYS